MEKDKLKSQPLLHTNMPGSSLGHHVYSLYVLQSRPVVPRQRSNSLPPGLALMNAEEAGILFSAAERATARRRKIASVDHSLPVTPLDNLDNSSISTNDTVKPSPLRQITSIRSIVDKPLPPEPQNQIVEPGKQSSNSNLLSAKSVPTEITLPESIFQTLPASPLSSPKRQVNSSSLKSYADGLFQFTQNRLTSAIPLHHIDFPEESVKILPDMSSESREPVSMVSPPSPRPLLRSRFSDWSITTGANLDSRRTSLSLTPIDLDTDLMSPDSFINNTEIYDPTGFNFNFNRFSGTSFASSETYEPPSTLPPETPRSRAPVSDGKDEVSYFTNYDMYLDPDTPHGDWPLAAEGSPEDVIIEFSPVEMSKSPQTPPPQTQRERANTAIRHPIPSAPMMQIAPPQYATCSTPSTPLQLAEVAVRVPHWLIGAIG